MAYDRRMRGDDWQTRATQARASAVGWLRKVRFPYPTSEQGFLPPTTSWDFQGYNTLRYHHTLLQTWPDLLFFREILLAKALQGWRYCYSSTVGFAQNMDTVQF